MDYLCAVNESLAFGGNSSSIKETYAEQAESSNEELQVVIQPHKSVSVGCPTASAEVEIKLPYCLSFQPASILACP